MGPRTAKMTPEEYKNEFLLRMYEQMWGNINRHILTVWQSIAAIGASLSVIVLSGKNIFSDDVSVSIIVLMSAWLISHVYDAQAWFDRNIAIIRNIETHFTLGTNEFHKYNQPRDMRLIAHLKIQKDMGLVLLLFSVVYHAKKTIIPICDGERAFEALNILPYLALLGGGGYVIYMYNEWRKTHAKTINSTGST